MSKYKVVQLQDNKWSVTQYGVVIAIFNDRMLAYAHLNELTN